MQAELPKFGVLVDHWFSDKDQVLCESTTNKGGLTKREFPENLLKEGEEEWNKWRSALSCPVRGTYNWVSLQFAKTINFSTLGFKSASSEPLCDPTSVEVYTLTAQETWSFSDAFTL